MRNSRWSKIPLTLAAATVVTGLTPLASAAPPADESVWQVRNRPVNANKTSIIWEDTATGSWIKLRHSDCRIAINRRYEVKQSNGSYLSMERVALVKANELAEAPYTYKPRPSNHKRHLTSGPGYSAGRIACSSDHPQCIRYRKRSVPGTGSWGSYNAAFLWLDRDWIDDAARCMPNTPGDSGVFSWHFVDIPSGPKQPIDLENQNNATLAADSFPNYNGNNIGSRHAACRVVDHGATLIGTVEVRGSGRGLRYNPFTYEFSPVQVTGLHQVCAINTSAGVHGRQGSAATLLGADRDYVSFEYLQRSTSNGNMWKPLPSNGNPPSGAFVAGTLDGRQAYLCMNTSTYDELNQDNGVTYTHRKRKLGYWYPGLDGCVSPAIKGSGSTQYLNLPNNSPVMILTQP